MFGLARKQLQVFNSVITWISVNVMNDLLRLKIAPKMLFHDGAVFKNVPKPRWFCIRRVWMVIWHNNKYVTILSFLASASPLWSLVLAPSKHRIIFSSSPNTVHRILVSSYITAIRWIGIGKIRERAGAAFRAELARPRRIGENLFFTLSTFRFNHAYIILVCGR